MARFTDVFSDETKRGYKIQTSEYLPFGKYPIIDQGQAQIVGYTNLENGLFTDVPAIIFGDHTRIVKYVDRPFFLGADGVKVLKAKVRDTDYKYLFYCLQNAKIPNTGYNRHFKWLKDVDIPLPPLEEQCQIAALLDKVSSLIAKRRQQLDKLDELIKARFVEMFGDPVSNPKGWQLVPLGECVTTIDNGKSFVCSNETRKNEWPAILKLSAVTYGEYNSNENKALLDSSQFIENAEVHSGDLLFTRKNTPELVGMAAYVYSSPAKLMMPDLIFRLNTKDNCSKIFLWQLINHELFRKNIQNIASGSAKSMSNISKERLMQLVIYLPPIKLQNHFAAFVEQTEKTKTTISKSLEKLETLKKALMQEYFG